MRLTFAKNSKFILLASIFTLFLSLTPNLNQSEAVYNGKSESGYEYVGYMFVELPSGSVGLCGVSFISPTKALTAAHCLENGYSELFVNTGDYDRSYETNSYSLKSAQMSPDYDQPISNFDAGFNDIAVIELEEEVSINTFAKIAKPEAGCDYYIVGYGRNEDQEQFDRRGIDICIDKVEAQRVIINKSESFFCDGDSGTGIYKKDTNQLVAIVSTYSSDTGCEAGDVFYGTRVDANIDFVIDSEENTQVEEGIDTNSQSDTLDSSSNVMILFAVLVCLCCITSIFAFIFLMLILKLIR